jgi:hypothetical protein
MVWSFLWRAAIYAPGFAYAVSLVVGFVAGLFGSTYVEVRPTAMPLQALAFLAGLWGAYLNAKAAQVSEVQTL